MEIEDIRQIILYEVDDINDVENLCYSDKTFYRLCSKNFWKDWYHKHQLDFPHHLNTTQEFIADYKLIMERKSQVNDMIKDMVFGNKNQKLYFQQTNNFILLGDPLNDSELIDFLKGKDWVNVYIYY